MAIKIWMVFEAVAATEEDLEKSLEEHVKKLREEEEGLEVVSEESDETEKIENPAPQIDEGFSRVTEVVVEVEKFSKAVSIVLNYGPTYVQIEEPEEWTMDMKDAQESLQKMATKMHQYAQQGAGGVIISKPSEG
ncbi:MAG: hypothetical protein ABEK01_00185 [Candidatus Nanohaloarchaea archaeon]